MSKYRVTMAKVSYYTADIETDSPTKAEEIANNDYLTALDVHIHPYDEASYVMEGETYKVEED